MSPGVANRPSDAMREALRERARDFELPALARVLAHLGYAPEDIEFCGHESWSPQPREIHAIEFGEPTPGAPRGTVRIVLELGLLSARTPLPHYFRKLLHDMELGPALRAHLQSIDHRLLSERCRALGGVHADARWQRALGDLRQLAGPGAPATVHTLFAAWFPELGVRVARLQGVAEIAGTSARIGQTRMGECCFGARAAVPVAGLGIALSARDQGDREDWHRIVSERLHGRVLPLLSAADVHLRITLETPGKTQEWARVGSEDQLGYDRMMGADAELSRAVVYEGTTAGFVARPVEKTSPAADLAQLTHAGRSDGRHHDKGTGT